VTTAVAVEAVSGSEQVIEARYGIKAGTLRTWRSRGEGPVYIKAGRTVIYMFADVEDYLTTKRVHPTA